MAVTRPQGGTLGELLNRGVKPVTKSVNIGEFQSTYIAQARYQNLKRGVSSDGRHFAQIPPGSVLQLSLPRIPLYS